jgi:hypothetical protein
MKIVGNYGDGFSQRATSKPINILLGWISRLLSIHTFGHLKGDYSSVLYLAVNTASEEN